MYSLYRFKKKKIHNPSAELSKKRQISEMYTNIQKTTSEIWILEQESKRNLTGHNYWEFPPFPQTTKNYSENTLKTTF